MFAATGQFWSLHVSSQLPVGPRPSGSSHPPAEGLNPPQSRAAASPGSPLKAGFRFHASLQSTTASSGISLSFLHEITQQENEVKASADSSPRRLIYSQTEGQIPSSNRDRLISLSGWLRLGNTSKEGKLHPVTQHCSDGG